MVNIKENERMSVLNHSCAHLLAQAVKHLYPDALFWVGPVIEEGFYYDIDLGDITITEEDLPNIEREMKKLSKDGKRIYREELSREEALEKFKNDPYKIDLINNMDDDAIISCYTQGDFTDLCRGPHVETVKELKYFKLLKVSGAYFKGDANNKMLQRIYGICFESEEELNEHLKMLEEAKKRDHKKLGRELELFFFDETAPGMPYWMPKGLKMFNTLIEYWREIHEARGYQEFSSPQVNKSELWKTSGHWDHYKDDMYVIEDKDGNEQAIKPMNCPNAMIMYKSKMRSYRDLPLRFSDVDVLHRDEASGALNGMFRVKMFRQDDSHNFIMMSQVKEEYERIFDIADLMYSVFGLQYEATLSTRPESFLGEIEVWDKAEQELREILDKKYGVGNYKVNEGDGAFYGPKVDLYMRDALGRRWQMGTFQLDMQLPSRFDLTYINEKGEKVHPVVIHRVIYGSLERFMGILVEHFAGAFPLWLSPVQVNIIPVNNEFHLEYAQEIQDLLKLNSIRVELDSRDEKLGYKMRESQTKKNPYTLILGDKEKDNKTVSYRKFGSEETTTLSQEEFTKLLKEEIKTKKYN